MQVRILPDQHPIRWEMPRPNPNQRAFFETRLSSLAMGATEHPSGRAPRVRAHNFGKVDYPANSEPRQRAFPEERTQDYVRFRKATLWDSRRQQNMHTRCIWPAQDIS